MKKFLKNMFLFSIPILIFLICMEIFLRSIFNEYQYKKDYLDKNSSTIEILILGSSHTNTGLDPNLLPKNTFNQAQGARSIDIDAAIFEKYKLKLKNLKILIIDISSFTLYDQLKNESKPYGSRMLEYNVTYGFNKADFLNYGNLVLNKNIPETLHSYYTQKPYQPDYKLLGWDPRDINIPDSVILSSGRRRASRHNMFCNSEFSDSNLKENYQHIKSMVDWCKKNKIKVVFITTPAHNSYCQLLDKQKWTQTKKCIADFVSNKNQIYYYNYLDNDNFRVETQDFYDADHLSKIGAIKLSKMVNDSILKILKR